LSFTNRAPEASAIAPLRTPRLLLRGWRDEDLPAFAALNPDPEVMRHFPAPLSRTESDALAARIRSELAERGFGLWAIESPGEAPFLGFVGLAVPAFQAPFTPCVEVGWRLAWRFWGRGYATEAAQAVLSHAFGELGMRDLVSFTTAGNLASRRVMEKLGMRRDPDEDFEHPSLSPGHPLRPHVLYRIQREAWHAVHG
jgi:ribosomal-protein-alanine N-acetyltransferase